MEKKLIDAIVKDAEENGIDIAIQNYTNELDVYKELDCAQKALEGITEESLEEIGIPQVKQESIASAAKSLNGKLFFFQSRISKNLRKSIRSVIGENSKKIKNMEEVSRLEASMKRDKERLAELKKEMKK